LWDSKTGKLLRAMPQQAPVVYVEFDPNAARILALDFAGTARIWNVKAGTEEAALQQKEVNRATFSPDGKRLATASESDLSVRVWDIATGALIARTISQPQRVVSLAFSPDGTRLATSDEASDTARIWNAQSGEPVTPPLQHAGRVMSVRFSADGRKVVSASADKSARVWDAATGAPLSEPLLHNDVVRYAEFSPDGRLVATASEDGRACVWDLSAEDHPVEDLEVLSQLVAARRIDETGAIVPIPREELRYLWERFQKLREPQSP
jgi:WD40 repeat protein